MLKFNADWRFKSPGEIPETAESEFMNLIGRIATQAGDRKEILELFKHHFAKADGSVAYISSSESWAESDLRADMGRAVKNAPLFIEAFYDACEALREKHPALSVPSLGHVNDLLAKHGVEYQIRPPDLVATMGSVPIQLPTNVLSLDEQAQQRIQEALSESDKLLSEGRDRAAVQEVLWLLETISTAFRGLSLEIGTIEGKYFNKILGELRTYHRGSAFEQIIRWIETLHGFLSSPTGGGVRHGSDLREGVALQPGEARLYCNLIRSYIMFLLGEHERLSKGG